MTSKKNRVQEDEKHKKKNTWFPKTTTHKSNVTFYIGVSVLFQCEFNPYYVVYHVFLPKRFHVDNLTTHVKYGQYDDNLSPNECQLVKKYCDIFGNVKRHPLTMAVAK